MEEHYRLVEDALRNCIKAQTALKAEGNGVLPQGNVNYLGMAVENLRRWDEHLELVKKMQQISPTRL
jgi:hypothetical protein